MYYISCKGEGGREREEKGPRSCVLFGASTQPVLVRTLTKRIDVSSVNQSVPGHDSISGKVFGFHPKLVASVRLELVHFSKGPIVKQQFETFSRRQTTSGMLSINSCFTTSHQCLFSFVLQSLMKPLFDHGRMGFKRRRRCRRKEANSRLAVVTSSKSYC